MMWFALLQIASAGEPPDVHATGFVARPDGQCEARDEARRGRCLDVVDLLDLDRAWGARPARPADRHAWRAVGTLYARTWEDLARRWTLPDVEGPMQLQRIDRLPEASRLWQAAANRDGTWSLPPRERWLGVGDWLDPLATPASPRDPAMIYPHVRYHGPEGQQPMPHTLRLAGRFAERLGFDGKAHDHDIMDGDPRSSGPFFEQLFPYQRRLTASHTADDPVYRIEEREPLTHFRFPRHLHDSTEDPLVAIRTFEQSFAPVTTDTGVAGIRQLASEEYRRFRRVVAVAAGQYAMQDITRNQMRVLTALAAMSTPPAEVLGAGGFARDIVAAARGETDTSEEILDRVEADPLHAKAAGAYLRHERLPRRVVEPWVGRLSAEVTLDPGWYDALNEAIQRRFPGLLREDVPALTGLDAGARRRWLRDAVLPGNDREEVDVELMQLALTRQLTLLTPARRERVESWMLLDHALGEIAATFDPTGTTAPRDLVEGATTAWQVTLALHGHRTQQLPQGLGAVDPTAICSTRDGLAGLSEPSFRRVDVDVLVAAAAEASVDELLAEAGPQMPFVMLDDPLANAPSITQLVRLGDGRALYRVRWNVWTGWHLLWDSAPSGAGRDRLLLRTGAICDDLVLAPPALTPTLIRAGLLIGNLRPTVPETGRTRQTAPSLDPAQLATQATAAPAEAMGTAEQIREVEVGAAVERLSAMRPGVGPSPFSQQLDPLRSDVSYLRGLVWGPLQRRLGAGPDLLFVSDIGPPRATAALRGMRSRTPYQVTRGRVPRRHVDDRERAGAFAASGWLWLDREAQRPLPLAPALAPTNTADDRPPRWKKRNTADFTLAGGLGAIPLRQIRFTCVAPDAGCPGDGRLRTEGLGGDLQAIGTLWRHGRRMLGVDAGLEARVDVRFGGPGLLWPDPDAAQLGLAIRPAAGLMVGIRSAPAPSPLERSRPNATPWGTARARGATRLGRSQQGLRALFLAGPGFTGPEGTIAVEGFTAWSARRDGGRRAPLTPWQPSALIGPFLRGQVGFPLGDPTEAGRAVTLDRSWGLVLGLRSHIRLAAPMRKPPEIE